MGYVKPAACAECHHDIAETYKRTGMARSFDRPSPDIVIEDYSRNNTFYHEKSDHYYTMYRRDDRFYIRRHQIGFDSKETNIVERTIDYVIGSGTHARTYLTRTSDNQFIELPISWYSERGGFWAMSPGYDRAKHEGFRRRIDPGCIFCHTGYPEIEEASDLFGGNLSYPSEMPKGIDCQRCHGPGEKHIQAIRLGQTAPGEIADSIVNPSRLSSEQEMEICMQCHLQTTSRPLPYALRRTNRGVFSYRPGQALADYMLHFDYARSSDDEHFEIDHAAYRLRRSACFQASGGALTCTKCHNPHEVKYGKEAHEAYTRVCQECHGPLPHQSVSVTTQRPAEDCTECHMPKRRTTDVVHVVMTDHYIQRQKPDGDLVAPLKELANREYQGNVDLYYPSNLPKTAENQLDVAVAQVAEGSNLRSGISQLQRAIEEYSPQNGYYYHILGEAYARTGQTMKATQAFEKTLRHEPNYLPSLAALGRLLTELGQIDRGAQILENAIALRPNDSKLLNNLGVVYLNHGDFRKAIASLKKGIRLDPHSPEAHNNLGTALFAIEDRTGAEAAFREAIRLQPDYTAAHSNLANVLADKHVLAEADYHFQKAIQTHPSHAGSRYNYGRFLAGRGLLGEAREQLEAAVELRPSFAEAHNELASVLVLQGDEDLALQEYRQAIVLESNFAEAHFNLGALLTRRSDTKEGKKHLQSAVKLNPELYEAHLSLGNLLVLEGDDPAARVHFQKAQESQNLVVRQFAKEGLKKLGRKQ